ncbi:hypothetical protein [Streptomyces sp. NPDC023588]|uniref:hypothetical protein n=1 Tax=Streptomyces sp. NPDC023588 TaxID=3154907 RepID=UPI0034015E3F
MLSGFYRFAVNWRGGAIHLALYRLADRHPAGVSALVNLVFGRRFTSWLHCIGPVDCFVSTFSLHGFLLPHGDGDTGTAPLLNVSYPSLDQRSRRHRP